MIRTGEINKVNRDEAQKISKAELIRYANKVRDDGAEKLTTFTYNEGIPFDGVNILVSPVFDEGERFLLLTIAFDPDYDIYMSVNTTYVLYHVGAAVRKWETKDGKEETMEIHYEFDEPEEFLDETSEPTALTISIGLGLDDAKIKNLMDVIETWLGVIAKVFIDGLHQAAIEHKKDLERVISDLDTIVNSAS